MKLLLKQNMKTIVQLFKMNLALVLLGFSLLPAHADAQTARACDTVKVKASWVDASGAAVTAGKSNTTYKAKIDFSADPNCYNGTVKSSVIIKKGDATTGTAVTTCDAKIVPSTEKALFCEFKPTDGGSYVIAGDITLPQGVVAWVPARTVVLTIAGGLGGPGDGGLGGPGGPDGTPTPSGVNAGVVATIQNPIPYDSIGELIVAAIRFILTMLGAVTVFFIVWGSVKMVISQGNESAIKNAKATIQWAVIGLVVALTSFSVIALVQSFLRRQ